MRTYIIKDLKSAIKYLDDAQDQVNITNISGSTRYYGTMVLDYVFQFLKLNYPTKINEIEFNVADDHIGLITVIKLGYKNIIYSGSSNQALAMLKAHNKLKQNTCIVTS